MNISSTEVTALLKAHIRLCYDVCHFAIGYEDQEETIRQLKQKGIGIGKIQISAALKGEFAEGSEREAIRQAFATYNEPVYLHQVVARKENGSLQHYPDLDRRPSKMPMIRKSGNGALISMFLFLPGNLGYWNRPNSHIRQMMEIQKNSPVTRHLEIETYTWEVLPSFLKLALEESIIRELQWVMELLDVGNAKS